jgi:hypothetical protein
MKYSEGTGGTDGVLLVNSGGTDGVLLADTYCAFKPPSNNKPTLTCLERVVLSLCSIIIMYHRNCVTCFRLPIVRIICTYIIVLKLISRTWNHVKIFNLGTDSNLQIISYFANSKLKVS